MHTQSYREKYKYMLNKMGRVTRHEEQVTITRRKIKRAQAGIIKDRYVAYLGNTEHLKQVGRTDYAGKEGKYRIYTLKS